MHGLRDDISATIHEWHLWNRTSEMSQRWHPWDHMRPYIKIRMVSEMFYSSGQITLDLSDFGSSREQPNPIWKSPETANFRQKQQIIPANNWVFLLWNFKTKLPAFFQNYRGPKLSVHSCMYIKRILTKLVWSERCSSQGLQTNMLWIMSEKSAYVVFVLICMCTHTHTHTHTYVHVHTMWRGGGWGGLNLKFFFGCQVGPAPFSRLVVGEQGIVTLLGLVMCVWEGKRRVEKEGTWESTLVCVRERERVCVCGTGHRDPFGTGDVCLRGEEREGDRGHVSVCVRESVRPTLRIM